MRIGCGMADGQHRQAAGVNFWRNVDGNAVHNAVRPAVEDHAPDVWQGGKLCRRDIVGINFTVYAQRADGAGGSGIFCAAEVQDDDHILLHAGHQPFYSKMKSITF